MSPHSTAARELPSLRYTIAAGLVAAVPPREEPGVLLGSYRGAKTRERRVVAAPPPGSRAASPTGSSQPSEATGVVDQLADARGHTRLAIGHGPQGLGKVLDCRGFMGL